MRKPSVPMIKALVELFSHHGGPIQTHETVATTATWSALASRELVTLTYVPLAERSRVQVAEVRLTDAGLKWLVDNRHAVIFPSADGDLWNGYWVSASVEQMTPEQVRAELDAQGSNASAVEAVGLPQLDTDVRTADGRRAVVEAYRVEAGVVLLEARISETVTVTAAASTFAEFVPTETEQAEAQDRRAAADEHIASAQVDTDPTAVTLWPAGGATFPRANSVEPGEETARARVREFHLEALTTVERVLRDADDYASAVNHEIVVEELERRAGETRIDNVQDAHIAALIESHLRELGDRAEADIRREIKSTRIYLSRHNSAPRWMRVAMREMVRNAQAELDRRAAAIETQAAFEYAHNI